MNPSRCPRHGGANRETSCEVCTGFAPEPITLHGIPVLFDPEAEAVPANLPTLAEELARVYGSTQVEGYFQPSLRVLAPGPDLYGKPAQARVGVLTSLRYVAPITDTAEAIRMLRTQSPWIPPVAP